MTDDTKHRTKRSDKASRPVLEGDTEHRLRKTIKGNEWLILSLYLEGKTPTEIAEELKSNPTSVSKFITHTVKALFRMYETSKLIESHNRDLVHDRYSWVPLRSVDSSMNKKFMAKLSEPDAALLTEEERTFCYLLVHEGNELNALKESSLDIGLKGATSSEYKRLASLRCTYLKAKPNLIAYMRELQVNYAGSVKVSKETLQTEILMTLSQLRNNDPVRSAPTIAKLLNDLGRTEGIFIDKTEIDNKLSLDDSFDLMLKRREELEAQHALPEQHQTIDLLPNPEGTTYAA